MEEPKNMKLRTQKNIFEEKNKPQVFNIELMLNKIIKKPNLNPNINNNKVKQNSSEIPLTQIQIMKITKKALRDQRNKRDQKTSVINMIKGKPYCLKLGIIEPNVDNFQGFYETFYSNIYNQESIERHGYVNLFKTKKHSTQRDIFRKRRTQIQRLKFFEKTRLYPNDTTKKHYLHSRPKSIDSEQTKISRKKILNENFNSLINSCNIFLHQTKQQNYEIPPIVLRKSTQLQCFK